MKPTISLRFFFDYNCGGCLWSYNDAAYEKFGVGCLDAETFDLNGNVLQNAQIELPENLKHKIQYLNQLYCESLDWKNPGGESLWNMEQWAVFNEQTKELYHQLIDTLGNEYEINYKQE